MATVSRAKRASNNKWDAQNMRVVSAKIKREDADRFREYAAARGKTVSGMITDYVKRCLEDRDAEESN